MVRPPEVELRVTWSEQFEVRGGGADRISQFAARWFQARSLMPDDVPVCVECVRELPRHGGLGSGTQLALATAAALNLSIGESPRDGVALASMVGRGRRSAVGTHGFERGGLILDGGKRSSGEIGRLARRIAMPETWQWVIWVDRDRQGLAGQTEEAAFARLSESPTAAVAPQLKQLAGQIIEAAVAAEFREFSEALYRFGSMAGKQFATIQGGPFNGPSITRRIDQLRAWGIEGVGQSSWGPAVFALVPDADTAIALRDRAAQCRLFANTHCSIASTDNHGMRVQTIQTTPADSVVKEHPPVGQSVPDST